MLSKLLKYEIKATGRIFVPLFLALLMSAGITRFISEIGLERWATPITISMAIYVSIMVGMFVMTFIMMIQRFNKNLLSDEGYLMHTLPVKPWKHIVSKLLISMFWVVTSGITAFISILIIALEKDDITKFTKGFTTFYHHVFEQLGTSAYILTFEITIGIFISLASAILIVYASIAIGHMFNKHKMMASFGAFIALNALSQIFFTLTSMLPIFDTNISIHGANDFLAMQWSIQMAIAYGIIIIGVLCAAYFATTNFILNKRLNLE